MTSLSTIRFQKKFLFLVLALLSIAVMLSVGSVSAWWENDSDSDSGTVNGVDWDGTATVGWSAPVPPGLIQYGGAGLTESDSVIDELYVRTRGSEYCGPFRMDIDWDKDNGVFDTVVVGESGTGSSSSFVCAFWYWQPNVVVRNDVWHQVWDGGGPTDSGETKAVIITDLVPVPSP